MPTTLRPSVFPALVLAAGLVASAAAHAGVDAFPGLSSFAFEGYNTAAPVWGPQPPQEPIHNLSICPIGSAVPCHYGTANRYPNTGFVLGAQMEQLANGAVLRGDSADIDPTDAYPYHVMSFELESGDFFSKNLDAHIAIAPRAYMPYSEWGTMVHGYAAFPLDSGTKVPYALGSGIMLGKVNCNNTDQGPRPVPDVVGAPNSVSVQGGVAIEHFLRPGATNPNESYCRIAGSAPPQNLFADNTTYLVNVAVLRTACTGPTGASGRCNYVGYLIYRKSCNGFGCSLIPHTYGGGTGTPAEFRDDSAVGGTSGAAGWSVAGYVPGSYNDRASWFISTVFTNAFNTVDSTTHWGFNIKNLYTAAQDTAPYYWSCLQAPAGC